VVVANFLGTSETADVYFAVMGIMFSFIFLIRELIYPSLLPVYSRALEESECCSHRFLFHILALALGSLGVIGILAAVLAQGIIAVLASGFKAQQRDTMAFLLRYLSPALILLMLMTVTFTVLNAQKKFIASALGELCFKSAVLLGYVFLLPRIGIAAIPVVIGIGAAIGLGFYLSQIGASGLQFCMPNSGDRRRLKDVLQLMAPLIIGVLFSHLSDIVDNAIASHMPRGQLSYLNYAKKVVDGILLIGPVAMVTVLYTQISHLAAKGHIEDLGVVIQQGVKLILVVVIPLACLLFLLREPIVRCLFQYGRFDGASTLGTSQALAVYSVGLLTFALETLLVYCFFALSDTKTPVLLGILGVLANIGLATILSQMIGYLGIAIALVIVKSVKVMALGILLYRRLSFVLTMSQGLLIMKIVLGSALATVTAYTMPWRTNGQSFSGCLVLGIILPGIVGAALYVFISRLWGVKEVGMVFSLLRRGNS